MANLADRLSLAMNSRGCSATQVAAALTEAGIPITRAYVSQLKSGKHANPTLVVLRAIADYLQVSVGWLIGEDSLPGQLGPILGLPDDAGLPENMSPESMTALRVVFELALRADRHQTSPAAADAAPLSPAQRSALGSRLRALRQAAAMPPQQARDAVGPSVPSVDDIEAGRSAPSAAVVERLLTLYGVHEFHQRERVLSLARGEREPDDYDHPGVPLAWAACHGLYQRAVLLRTYHNQQIPVLLQTEQYAGATGGADRSPAVNPQSAAWRALEQNELLERSDPPRLWVVIDEAALLRQADPDPRTQLAQLDAIIQAAKRESVTVQITPLDAPVVAPPTGPFTLLRFAEPFTSDVVVEQSVAGDRLLSDPLHVDAYNRAFARLAVASATRGESLQLLHAHRQRVSGLLT